MSAEPYWYIVKYRRNIDDALQELRQREFEAGRYNPVIPFPEFPIDENSPAPGAEHDSIEDALEEAAEDGTRSILDLYRISDEPDYGRVVRLPDEVLEGLYGTTRPTREMVQGNQSFFSHADRLQGIYIVLYRGQAPDEILFAAYSAD